MEKGETETFIYSFKKCCVSREKDRAKEIKYNKII